MHSVTGELLRTWRGHRINDLALTADGRHLLATPSGEAWKQTIYDGLADFHLGPEHLKFAYVDFSNIWDAVLDNGVEGYESFGFVSTDACTDCTEDCNQYGWCTDPDHYFSWFGGYV